MNTLSSSLVPKLGIPLSNNLFNILTVTEEVAYGVAQKRVILYEIQFNINSNLIGYIFRTCKLVRLQHVLVL